MINEFYFMKHSLATIAGHWRSQERTTKELRVISLLLALTLPEERSIRESLFTKFLRDESQESIAVLETMQQSSVTTSKPLVKPLLNLQEERRKFGSITTIQFMDFPVTLRILTSSFLLLRTAHSGSTILEPLHRLWVSWPTLTRWREFSIILYSTNFSPTPGKMLMRD